MPTLDAEISRIQDHLRDLQEKRTGLATLHSQHTGILSPLRRMPPEILYEIFSWTVPLRDVFRAEKSPWILTRVCSGWRAIALSQPSLWSLLVFDFSIEQQYPLKMVLTQIERARWLKVHFFGSEVHVSGPQLALFGLLAEHSARWEELSIQLTSDLVPHMRSLKLPALHRAWVQWDTPESQPAELESVDFLQTATSLVDITVYSEFRFLPTHIPVFRQLTRYDFDAPWKTHRELLKSLPNLHEVRIRRYFDDGVGWAEPSEPIDLLRLRWLYVDYPTCLDYLRAPVLEEIAIAMKIRDTDNTEISRSLERFFVRSSCSPRRLCVQGLLDASITTLLEKYPSITEIDVTDEDEEDENIRRTICSSFLTLFTIPEPTPSQVVLPHITKIGLACETVDVSLFALFLNMLESRWTALGCSLKATELLLSEPTTQPDLAPWERIEMLRQAGLEISLVSGGDASTRVDEWLFRAAWT
ncbi:hypothetical protein MSAN_01098500 [Mycena sanguinolenta]|uniref:F-box domain-containing protein n=1 Tax=Mycena sanguinolenta TaxID=230812 RepID=A0A8H7DA07_9AGAR|nr:hypothetical protein MSAN_01098500 [Mycena sanguinolenta]